MNQPTTQNESVLKTLRDLVPPRRLTYTESLRVAELQANRFLEIFEVTGPFVPAEIVTELPRVSIRNASDMPVSGSAHWEEGQWVITLNSGGGQGSPQVQLDARVQARARSHNEDLPLR